MSHFKPADRKSALRSQTALRKKFAGQSLAENAQGDSQSTKPVKIVLHLGHFVRANPPFLKSLKDAFDDLALAFGEQNECGLVWVFPSMSIDMYKTYLHEARSTERHPPVPGWVAGFLRSKECPSEMHKKAQKSARMHGGAGSYRSGDCLLCNSTFSCASQLNITANASKKRKVLPDLKKMILLTMGILN